MLSSDGGVLGRLSPMRLSTAMPSQTRPRYFTPCAQCGDALLAPEWSEHVSERCVRHLWTCETCGYEFETTVYLGSRLYAPRAALGRGFIHANCSGRTCAEPTCALQSHPVLRGPV